MKLRLSIILASLVALAFGSGCAAGHSHTTETRYVEVHEPAPAPVYETEEVYVEERPSTVVVVEERPSTVVVVEEHRRPVRRSATVVVEERHPPRRVVREHRTRVVHHPPARETRTRTTTRTTRTTRTTTSGPRVVRSSGPERTGRTRNHRERPRHDARDERAPSANQREASADRRPERSERPQTDTRSETPRTSSAPRTSSPRTDRAREGRRTPIQRPTRASHEPRTRGTIGRPTSTRPDTSRRDLNRPTRERIEPSTHGAVHRPASRPDTSRHRFDTRNGLDRDRRDSGITARNETGASVSRDKRSMDSAVQGKKKKNDTRRKSKRDAKRR